MPGETLGLNKRTSDYHFSGEFHHYSKKNPGELDLGSVILQLELL